MSRRRPSPEELLEVSPYGSDLDHTLSTPPPRAKPSKLTLALSAGLLLMAGVLLGIQLQKAAGVTMSSDRQAAIAAALSGGQGQRAQGGQDQSTQGGLGGAGQGGPGQGGPGQGNLGGLRQGGPLGNATFGTVTRVDGNKIYIDTMNGTAVITAGTETKIQVTKEGKVADIQPGSTIVAQGERDADGNVAATSITEGGRFPGFGGRR